MEPRHVARPWQDAHGASLGTQSVEPVKQQQQQQKNPWAQQVRLARKARQVATQRAASHQLQSQRQLISDLQCQLRAWHQWWQQAHHEPFWGQRWMPEDISYSAEADDPCGKGRASPQAAGGSNGSGSSGQESRNNGRGRQWQQQSRVKTQGSNGSGSSGEESTLQ
eukprot:7087888-Pyramimonas_sp.AAC.1